jgi:cyclase
VQNERTRSDYGESVQSTKISYAAIPRVIPCLLIRHGVLVKTVKFRNPKYIGDPLNAVRIFNEKEVDELVFLDITASREGRAPDVELIGKIAAECFMPFAYGGGVRTLTQARRIMTGGAEKVILNSVALEGGGLVEEVAAEFGNQSVVVAIDVKRTMLGRARVFNARLQKLTNLDPAEYASRMVAKGAGEILINDVNRDGTQSGYDVDLIAKIAKTVAVPVIACGGAGGLHDLRRAVDAGAAAVAAGSFFVLYGKHRAVLITYPDREKLRELFSE